MAAFVPRRAPLMPLAGLAIVLIAAVAAFLMSHAMAVANREVNRSIEVRVGLAEFGRLVARHDASFRAYVITGLPEQRLQALGADADVVRQFGRLSARMSDEPTQRTGLDRLRPEIAARLGYVRRKIGERGSGGSGRATATERDFARAVIARIDAQLRAMSAEEQRLLGQREGRAQRLISWLSVALAGAVLLVVVVAYLTVNDALQRFQALRAATREARASATRATAEASAREEAEAQLRQIQKMESIGQLTGGIAHDFNNMLAVIVGSLDLARRRIADPARAERHISDALEGAGRATTLVSRLLAFSRRQPLEPSGIAVDTFLADLADILRRMVGEAITVKTELGADTWTALADPVQLENAVLNLAVNARDAMGNGGTLTLATVNRELYDGDASIRSGLPAGDYVEISVRDTGTGMSEDILARAFDPFFTTKAVGRGTGLGLSQVFGFVRQSGGLVTIDSAAGRGSTVRILLPRYDGEPAAVTKPIAAVVRAAPTEQRRILLVEDDERVRRFSAEALAELGYLTLTAASGTEALRILGDEPAIAILFTDVVMPGMSGPELAATVRAARPDIKVLFTTGYNRGGANAALIADLDAPVLPKPFAIQDLDAKLRALFPA